MHINYIGWFQGATGWISDFVKSFDNCWYTIYCTILKSNKTIQKEYAQFHGSIDCCQHCQIHQLLLLPLEVVFINKKQQPIKNYSQLHVKISEIVNLHKNYHFNIVVIKEVLFGIFTRSFPVNWDIQGLQIQESEKHQCALDCGGIMDTATMMVIRQLCGNPIISWNILVLHNDG